jgi:hypothetical protein
MSLGSIRLIALATVLLPAAVLRGQPGVLTWHNDSARTGQNLAETFLTPANVNSTTFGRLATLTVDGKVDAQPLYVPGLTIPNQGVHNVLYVATEHGSLYAFDADTFAQLLKVSLLAANETPASVSCTQVTPEIGITGTPAIDLQAGPHGMIFAVSQSQDASLNFHHRLHALDLPTLTEQLGGPVNIAATYPGSGAENTFNVTEHVARPALLILNGLVYTSWGSHCDSGNYAGWILSYSETTLAQVGVLNVVPNGSEGGIWSAGSGPAADANGNIYALIGNGTFDPTLNASGFPGRGDYGNSMVKVSTSGALSVVDYFTMSNTVSESNADTDFGSAGLMLLPPLDNGTGTGTDVSLAVGAGKDHNIYVVNQANLGKFNSNADSIYQQLSGALPGGTWSSPAWFNGNLYYAGAGDNLRQFTFIKGSFSLTGTSSAQFSFPGATPSISANGISNGIVWAMQNLTPAVLHAYSAANFPTELYNSNQAPNNRDQFGAGNKYIAPTVVNGKVYVGTTTGVGVFGLFPSISIAKSHTGSFTQGQQGASYTLTVSNAAGVSPTTSAVTVTETIPTGLTLSGMSGSGWTCPTGGNTCTRSDALPANSSYPAIIVTVNVAANAPASVTNTATVAGGGDSTTTNKTANDVTNISTPLTGPPALSSPTNSAAGVSLTPSLSWTAVSGATSYDVYFGASSPPPLVTNVTVTSYAPAALVANTTYYWQVVAKNSAGSTSSAIFSFTTYNSSCTFAVTPPAVLIAYTGGSASVSVTAGSGCAWTATSSTSWLTIASGSSGSGNGTISFAANANSSSAQLAYLRFASQTVGVMQGGSPSAPIFTDVPPTDQYFDYVSLMSSYGITVGCQTSPPLYCGSSPVTRAEMSVFVVRGLDLATGVSLSYPATAYFQDVPASGIPDSEYFPYVQRIAQLGITVGCVTTPPMYCPDASITQAQMAVFMIRAWMLANNLTTFTYPSTPYYTDVPATDEYFSYIQKMTQLGFWTGCTATTYCENSAVTRDQMAPIILRSMLGAP